MSTSKIAVIIAHEYGTRVRSKWFIIATLLGPLLMSLFVVIPVVATMLAGDGTEGRVAVIDRTGQLLPAVLQRDSSLYVDAGTRSETALSDAVRKEELQAYVVIPADVLDGRPVTMFSRGGSGIAFESRIRKDLEPGIVEARLRRAGTDTSVIRLVEQGVEVTALKVTEQGVEQDASKASAAIGYAAGFVIYILIFLYGSMVMRGVVEEKANRIIEVIASSVRPFDIMMGKVVGIGLVGLTQVVAWGVLGTVLLFALSMILGPSTMADAQTAAAAAQMQQPMGGAMAAPTPAMIGGVALPSISIWTIVTFVFYFLSGYFFYATLFAAVGSAVDQEADANTLTMPVTMPVVLTILFIGNVVANPNGTFAVVLSLIPLFSPIIMTVRAVATDVPLWQLLLSMALSVGGFFGSVWLASRIYRIGILSYGRKPTFKDIGRWITTRV